MITAMRADNVIEITGLHNVPLSKLRAVAGAVEIGAGVWTLPATEYGATKLFDAFAGKPMRIDKAIADMLADPLQPRNIYTRELDPIPFTHTAAWRHQIQAYWFSMDRTGAVLGMFMGTGKTKVAIDIALNMAAKRMLVICPKSVVANWPRELAIHWGDDVTVCAVDTKKPLGYRVDQVDYVLRTTPAEQPLVIIMNYDAFKNDKMLDKLTGAWDVMVVDESHKIADPSTQIAKACYKIGPMARKRLAMSGTPFKQQPLDIYGQARFVNPEIFGTQYYRFRNYYGDFDDFGKFVGLKERDKFEKKIASFVFQCDRDVLDLPPVTHSRRYFQLSDAARKIYQRLDEDWLADVDDIAVNPANGGVKLLRLQQISSGYVGDDNKQVHEVDTGKQALYREYLDEIDVREPLVVFARFRHDLDAIHRITADTGRRYVELSGRRNDLEAFQAGHADVIGVQIQSGGAGINLTRARYGVYYSIGHSLTDFDQSTSRMHRPGQNSHVNYTHLLAEDTKDDDVYAALQHKRNVIEYVAERSKVYAQLSA